MDCRSKGLGRCLIDRLLLILAFHLLKKNYDACVKFQKASKS